MLAPLPSAVLQRFTIIVFEIILYSVQSLCVTICIATCLTPFLRLCIILQDRGCLSTAIHLCLPFYEPQHHYLSNTHIWTHSFGQSSTHSLQTSYPNHLHETQIYVVGFFVPYTIRCPAADVQDDRLFARRSLHKQNLHFWLHPTVHGGHPRVNAMRYTTLSANRADSVRWYWRTLAICAACLILGGFLVVPSAFDTQPQLRVSQTILGGFGVGLLALGFSLAALASFCSRSWAFSAEYVFVPCIFACLIGFLNVPYCFSISTRFKWNSIAMTTTIGAAAAAFVFTALYVFARRRLTRPQPEQSVPSDHIDLLRRPSNASAAGSYHTQSYFANHFANMYPAARTSPSNAAVTPPNELPVNDTEIQRRRMSDLLHKPESHVSPATSPFNRIDFNLDETETPINGYYAPVATTNLSTRSFGNSAWHGRNESWTTNDSRRNSSREERRREIELGR
ncbi:hypothetical protein E4T42_05731 [Aureobasidium subglaciale]|nr:hypothetical protein E4T42_05731 [Aureobasidium subglaciale]